MVEPADTVCRAEVEGGCDIEETCDGNSNTCPEEVVQPAGEVCGEDLEGICIDLECVLDGTLPSLCLGGSPNSTGPQGPNTLDDGEECDDGNMINYDACTNACTLPACGDGIISHIFIGPGSDFQGIICDPGATGCPSFGIFFFSYDVQESCDDGNTDDGDGCSATCRREYCGDGVFQPAVWRPATGRCRYAYRPHAVAVLRNVYSHKSPTPTKIATLLRTN